MDQTPPEARYVAAGHIEGKAALQVRAAASSGGTIHHNNPFGTCIYCQQQVPTLLPDGARLTAEPPAQARPRSAWWSPPGPVTMVGNVADPASHPVATAQSPHPATTESGHLGIQAAGRGSVQPHGGHRAGEPARHEDGRPLDVFDLAGYHHVPDAAALDALLAGRGSADHYEISASPPAYPLLTAAFNGEDAVLHWFAGPGHPGLQSVGPDRDGPSRHFPDPAGQDITLPADTVVPAADAERAVRQFAASGSRPDAVGWREL
ncbi:hypothetical protein G7070_08395 [Propioniciclava coleopterorum]|uniref:Immunity protein Imm1 n=2 Tax=Propioniciclava coleopterorum TaxID=2714937 RepID=A0A6G7Y5W3_9ACTN|nr:Imm1 family immunity protein [Propioniciclava coleopterorum]QIK72284.1 hypothetical protein G7070_08395 [Propioniciclava coleopterorum]